MGFRILKRNNFFYVRVWVPLDIRGILKRSELKKSLKTGNRAEARVLASGLLHKAETMFMQARSGMLTDRQLEVLAGELISEFTGTMDKMRKERMMPFDVLDSGQLPNGLSSNLDFGYILGAFKYAKSMPEVRQQSDGCQGRLEMFTNDLMTGIFSDTTRNLAERLVKEKGLDVVLPPPEWFDINNSAWYEEPPADFGRLCQQVATALRTSYQLEHEQINGDADSDFRRRTLARIEEARPKPKLSDLWADYQKYKKAKGKWNVRTENNYLRFYIEATELLGDKELYTYTQNNAIDYINTLKKLGNTSQTCSGKVEFLSSLYKFALKTPESTAHWCIKGNPFVEMQTEDAVPINHKKIPYTDEDLRALLTGLLDVRKQAEPHRFWVPLIALYTGARQNEICQLRVDDIEYVGGVLVFNIRHNPALKQSVKAKNSRTCPVHPMLKQLGFIKYWEEQQRQKRAILFNTLTHTDGKGWSGKIRGWWNEQFQEEHVQDTKGKSFHSFRGTFINWFKQNKCYDKPSDRSVLQSMVGHDGDGSVK